MPSMSLLVRITACRGLEVPKSAFRKGISSRPANLGIGLVEKLLPDKLVAYTPWADLDAVACLKLGKLRLDRQADYTEAR